MTENPKGFADPRRIVAPRDLQAWLCDSARVSPLIIELRPAERYARGAIHGAVHLDLWGVSLIDTDPAPLRAFLWIVEHQLALRGVTDDRPVVVYDDEAGVRAARAFWFLEYFGHPDVRLLDGGYTAWVRERLPVSQDPVAPSPSSWTGRPVAERLATWHDVRSRLFDEASVLLDTRSDEEYCGALVRARRGGAIPGAVHVEWRRALDAEGALRHADELRALFREAGVSPEKEVIAYCQGGYRGAHSYLVLRVLGYPRVRNYLGSWKEWGDRLDLPVEQPRPVGSDQEG